MRLHALIVGGVLSGLLFAPLGHAQTLPTTQIPTGEAPPSQDPNNPLDMTKGQGSIPHQYSIEPVPEGQLKLEQGKQAEVKGQDGKMIGKLERAVVDTKTGKPEYGIVSLSEDQRLVALPWSSFNFNRDSGNVTLNLSRPEMESYATGKDQSPDFKHIQGLVKDLQGAREKKGIGKGLGVTERPASGGPMGEDKTGGAAPSGPRAEPPSSKSPGFEGAGKH